MGEPSHTPKATCIQTAALASVISSLITALSLVGIFITVFGIKRAHSSNTGRHSSANEDVYEAVGETMYDGIAMNMKNNDAYHTTDVTVSMAENEAYGIGPALDSAENS